VGVFLFEIAAGVGDAVDCGEDFGLVAKVGVGEAAEVHLFALEVGVEVGDGGPVGLEDGVHAALLIGGEVELFGGAVVVPPAAGGAKLEAHAGLAVGVEGGAIDGAGCGSGAAAGHHPAGGAGSHGMSAAATAVLREGWGGDEGEDETQLRDGQQGKAPGDGASRCEVWGQASSVSPELILKGSWGPGVGYGRGLEAEGCGRIGRRSERSVDGLQHVVIGGDLDGAGRGGKAGGLG